MIVITHVTVTCDFNSGQHCGSGDASGPEVSQALCAASRTGENYIGGCPFVFLLQ